MHQADGLADEDADLGGAPLGHGGEIGGAASFGSLALLVFLAVPAIHKGVAQHAAGEFGRPVIATGNIGGALTDGKVTDQLQVSGGFAEVTPQRVTVLADTAMAITTSRLLCYHALEMIDAGERANQISAMAKRYSLEACQRAISMAMEVHGAMGISRELGLEQLFRDCRMLPIPDGTNQILALIEGRELTGIQAYRA